MRVLIVLLVIFFILQIFPSGLTNPPATAEITVSQEIKNILKESCFDCHSNGTDWPFYSKIKPISWLVVKHVNDARKKLNFSEWKRYSITAKTNLKKEIWKEISEDQMPLPMYTWFHPSASLNLNEKKIIKKWALGK